VTVEPKTWSAELTAAQPSKGGTMSFRKTLPALILFLATVVSAFDAATIGNPPAQEKSKKAKAEKEKPRVVDSSEGHPVLWNEPISIETLDLFYGSGGSEGAPDARGKFTYVGDDTKGTQKKIYVKDDQGRDWTVKFGAEARPETAAARFVWAMGYHADEDYFVDRVHIDGMSGGDARNVRFERRHDGLKSVGLWTWEENPFVGTRELDGLKVLMIVMNNWDLKVINNKVVRPTKKSGEDTDDRIYYVGDLGATFGKTGSLAHELHLPGDPPAGSKDKPNQYAHQDFIDGVRDGMVRFHYKGKDPGALKGIRVETAKWMGDMLGRLSQKQLTDAFRAGGYSQSEIATLVRAMQERIRELQSLK
jgi:hypothetical protein